MAINVAMSKVREIALKGIFRLQSVFTESS